MKKKISHCQYSGRVSAFLPCNDKDLKHRKYIYRILTFNRINDLKQKYQLW